MFNTPQADRGSEWSRLPREVQVHHVRLQALQGGVSILGNAEQN